MVALSSKLLRSLQLSGKIKRETQFRARAQKTKASIQPLSLTQKVSLKCFWMKANPESSLFSEISGPKGKFFLTYAL